MPFAGGRYRFTRSMVDGAPADPGVYALWEGEELIYYGCAAGLVITIQVALLEHLSGRAGSCTQRATHYGWEICLDPLAREAELLAEHQAAFQRLPRCNRGRA
ncbi:MAG TPA: hypothetical protein VM489_11385 [Burkholderiales bacterium]|nr:hypothetical protein [Burkholderiales bacterium]